MNLRVKRTICLMGGIISILTIVGTISYAYFTATAQMVPTEATLTTGTARVRFADNDNGVVAQLNFGESITKKFTIENTGTVDANVRMYWENLVNTYTERSLTYTLSYSETENGSYTEVIGKTNVPRSQSPSRMTLANSLTIPVGQTYYYELTITLNYLSDVNQDPDLNAVFNTNFGIEDIHESYRVTFDANGGTVATSSMAIVENKEYGILPTPTREGYEFLGWYIGEVDGELITITSTVKINDNHILYAHWKEIFNAVKASQAIVNNQKPNGVNGTKSSFNDPATTDEGVFEMEDDYGTSYYYRGAVTNNYVKFAGFYWRIIRVNGDGSMRIIYDGEQAYANGANNSARFIGTSAYNTSWNDAKYVGYMYGPVGATSSTSKAQAQTNTSDSTIKTYIDNWYKTNIVDKGYSSAIVDILFCNDRSTPGSAATGLSNDTGLGYGKNVTLYGGHPRIVVNYGNVTPTFKCPQKNDAFTVSDTVKGNGSLTYPVGLIIADEVVAAGSGKFGTPNSSYYLYRPSNLWWTFSPSSFNGSAAYAFTVNTNGSFSNPIVNNNAGAVAPVLNLSVEYVSKMIGDGTMENPYREASDTL